MHTLILRSINSEQINELIEDMEDNELVYLKNNRKLIIKDEKDGPLVIGSVMKDKYNEIDIRPYGIFSSDYDSELFCSMQTIKNIMIKKGLITEEEYETEYSNIMTNLHKQRTAKMVRDKLIN